MVARIGHPLSPSLSRKGHQTIRPVVFLAGLLIVCGIPPTPAREGAGAVGVGLIFGRRSGGSWDGLGVGAGAGLHQGHESHEGAEVEGVGDPGPFEADFLQATQQDWRMPKWCLICAKGRSPRYFLAAYFCFASGVVMCSA